MNTHLENCPHSPTAAANFIPIEIYGQAKVSYDMIDTGAKAPADQRVHKISSNSSRLGFKGAEDLGDGMSAAFQVELGVNVVSILCNWYTPKIPRYFS